MLCIIAFLLVEGCFAAWHIQEKSKTCHKNVLKSIKNYSRVQCVASCKRSHDCETIFFTKGPELSGTCLHLKHSLCDKVNETGIERKNQVLDGAVDLISYTKLGA